MAELVLIRHGQSLWNAQNLFTGWTDIDLSEQGQAEAKQAAALLKKHNLLPDHVFSSVLTRAIRTAWIIMDELSLLGVPHAKHWRLNERHYGNLQGKNKQQMREEFGEEQVKLWRRSYSTRPPEAKIQKLPSFYEDLKHSPACESLEDTTQRVVAYWESTLRPCLENGKNVLVAAHGNSLRGLLKHLCQISEEAIVKLEVATGTPLLCTTLDHKKWSFSQLT